MALCYAVSVVLVVTGYLFWTGGAVRYIKDYQNMTEEEKSAVNIKPLCKNMSVLFFLAAVIFAAAGYNEGFRTGVFKLVMVGYFMLCFADVVFINKSKRYKN